MKSENTYRNPFADYNANVMNADMILDCWCDPFMFIKFSIINEQNIYKENNPIVFMGGRGSGKTMFFRYWSYDVQKLRALSDIRNNNLIENIKKQGGIGFYLRIDGPVLRSFAGYDVKPETWNYVFTHYFELVVAKSYLEVLNDLFARNMFNPDSIATRFIPKLASLLNKKTISSLSEALEEIDNLIAEVNAFRGLVPIENMKFKPRKGFLSQELSFGIPELVQKTIDELHMVKFVLFIDEYENFSEQQQRMVNALVKFAKPHTTFRVGMRLEGFKNFATGSNNEFIKDGRDYSVIIIEDVLIKDKGYQNYLKGIAQRRLERVESLRSKGFTDITKILGNVENLEEEAIELTKGDSSRLFKYFDKIIPKDAKELIADSSKPLLELLNILWIQRGNYKPKEIQKIMNDYLQKKHTEDTKKYRLDYVDKYKMSLMFLLASIYRDKKKYYSFNTFCFLSSGIVGHFIELCRHSFMFAEFENRDSLFKQGIIAKEQQDKAAREVASNELQSIQRIEDFGGLIYKFTINLGNIFSDYHKDICLRYPETNQFSVDKNRLTGEYKDAFNASLRWSVIQRKPSIQKSSPDKGKKDVYTLNRIYSPQFGISYRTRGGISEEYGTEDIINLMTKDDVKPQKMKAKGQRTLSNQEDLFGKDI